MTTEAPGNSKPILSRRNHISDIGTLVLIGFAGPVLSSLAILTGGDLGRASASAATLALVHGSIAELAGLAFVFTVVRYRAWSIADLGMTYFRQDWLHGIGLFFASWLSYIAAFYLLFWLGMSFPTDTASKFASLQMAHPAFLLIYILINPWFEEILVRGFLTVELESLLGNKWGPALVTTLFQGAYHLYQGWMLAFSLSIGFLVFAIYFARTRRLYPIIIAHALADLLSYSSLIK